MMLERISPRTARPAGGARGAGSGSGSGRAAVAGAGLRGVPNRPAPGRRRAGSTGAAAPDPRPPGGGGRWWRPAPAARASWRGDCIGVAWLGATCGGCSFCCSGRENLCTRALFTGYTTDGGYAELMLARAGYVFSLGAAAPADPAAVAPLLCAGMIGYRAYRKARPALNAGGGPVGAVRVRLRGRGCCWPWRVPTAMPSTSTPAPATCASRNRRGQPVPPGPAAPTPRRRNARRRHHPGPGGRPGSGGPRGGGARRHRGMRRHPHERHSHVPLRSPVARTGAVLGGQF